VLIELETDAKIRQTCHTPHKEMLIWMEQMKKKKKNNDFIAF